MKKEIGKSPDEADSLMMGVYASNYYSFLLDYSNTNNPLPFMNDLFLQFIPNDDTHCSQYEETFISPYCKKIILDVVKLYPSKELIEQYCANKMDELIKLSASFIAITQEKLSTTGSSTLNSNQIDEICATLELEERCDLCVLFEISSLYSKSIFSDFFSQWSTAISQFTF